LFDPEGLVYFGYPLVAMGKTEPRDTSHLEGLRVPQLFVTGTRDRMGPGDLVAELADRVPSGRFEPIESGDHSFKPLVATGRTVDDSIRTAAALVAAWWSAYAPGGV
ncbi:MAG: dienelactone hydrolase, partial [Acidimicrobiia bacterium]|nr:dienelactone hydrolase [Acidimicrobiia bacterium]